MYAFHLLLFPSGSSNILIDNKLVQSDATPNADLYALHEKLKLTLKDIRSKRSKLTVQELRRLLYRCAAVLMSLSRVSFVVAHLEGDLFKTCHEQVRLQLIALLGRFTLCGCHAISPRRRRRDLELVYF